METALKTHVGHLRQINEDSGDIIRITDQALLAVVADGMGGHQAGDVASQMTLETIRDGLGEVSPAQNLDQWEMWLRTTIQKANSNIYRYAQDNPSHLGMGTTVVTVLFLEQEYMVAHVGDSRLYRYHEDKLEVLTEDHSLVRELVQSGEISEQEAEIHPQRNVITRALGTDETIDVDLKRFYYSGDEQFLLCSDGLNAMATDQQIEEVLHSDQKIETKADTLLQLALDAGGEDNITLVLVRSRKDEQHGPK